MSSTDEVMERRETNTSINLTKSLRMNLPKTFHLCIQKHLGGSMPSACHSPRKSPPILTGSKRSDSFKPPQKETTETHASQIYSNKFDLNVLSHFFLDKIHSNYLMFVQYKPEVPFTLKGFQ